MRGHVLLIGGQGLFAGLASGGDQLVITAGVPFGTPGRTNLLRIAWVDG